MADSNFKSNIDALMGGMEGYLNEYAKFNDASKENAKRY